jgi:hypothetical protein
MAAGRESRTSFLSRIKVGLRVLRIWDGPGRAGTQIGGSVVERGLHSGGVFDTQQSGDAKNPLDAVDQCVQSAATTQP